MAVNQQKSHSDKSLLNNLKTITKNISRHSLALIIGTSTLIMFVASSVRHILFQSTAFDLGIFDQGVHQYSVPAVPFLILAVIATLAAGKGLIRSQRGILIWSLIGFLALAKYTYFFGIYLDKLDTWQATREAVSRVQPQVSVLTTASISPHLSHRQVINLAYKEQANSDVIKYDSILMDARHPGWNNDSASARRLVDYLKNRSDFKLVYERTDVYLFQKTN